LRGIYCYQMMTVEGFKNASEYFEQALQKDPNYALAYFGLALVCGASTFFGNVPPNEGYPKANELCSKALKLDNTLAEAYWQLGNNNTFYYWNWKEAERNYKYAIQINPNSPLMHTEYSMLLSFIGRHEEAIYEAKRAQELDPFSAYVNTLAGCSYVYAGQLDRAIEEWHKSLTINPNYFMTHLELGGVYLLKSMFKESVAEYEKAADLSDGNAFVIGSLVSGYYLNGAKDKADMLFEKLKKRTETEYVPPTSFYLIHKFKGEEDLAFEWLKRACTEHDTFLPLFRITPNLIPESSRYIALLKEVGLVY